MVLVETIRVQIVVVAIWKNYRVYSSDEQQLEQKSALAKCVQAAPS